MKYFLCWYKVADYAQWKAVFEAHAPSQLAAGLSIVKVWVATEDPNRIVVLFAIEDQARCEAFLTSPEVPAMMRAANVLEAGGDFLVEVPEAGSPTSPATP